MSELEIINTALGRAARRRRWDRAWRRFWRGFLLGGSLWLLALLAYKFLPVPYTVCSVAGGLALLLTVAGFGIGWWRAPTLAETARWVDGREKLQERLSTALEVATRPTAADWRALVLADAARHAQGMDARRLLPFRLPAAARWTALVLALSVGLGFVPEYRSKDFLQKKKEADNLKDTGRQLADLVRRSLKSNPPVAEPTRRTLEETAALGEQLTKAKLTRGEALKELASATDKLKQDLKEAGKNPALRKLEQAARAPAGDKAPSAAALQKQLEALQKSLGEKKAANPDALDKLKRDLDKLKEAAAGLSKNDSADSAAAREQMAKSLAALSQQAKDLGASLPSLEAAIEALKNNQADLFLRDLKLALDDLEKMQQLAKAMEQLQQMAEKLGKDLAEQLQNGQAELAQQTLQKMIDQLKSADLTPEQLKKLLAEVSQAVGPASPYGKVGELLKQASAQLQQGEKAGASQSLASAAAELQKLMEQMGDAQSLGATLNALQRAQMAIGNGQAWGSLPGNAPPKSGKSAKGGTGFGTWADDYNWNYPQKQELWENPLERQAMKQKGLTERDTDLNENLTPTKARSQFSPGGSMPSITLKGVSIAGQSRVAVQEAVVAAQGEAQGALNQEQVPRAYQGAVRDYFDDLKP